jgi:hypothetical protein
MLRGNKFSCLLFIVLVFSGPITAQYFGKNKPFYRTFDFKLVETPHFQIYHYFKDETTVERLASMSEKWYRFHEQVLLDTFNVRSPIIFYENHADFQQTTAIMGNVDVGVGGVTEGLKNRVVMPMGLTWQQTNHVLGHELVHAFQFHMLLQSEGMGLSSLQNIPLWMIEGMAEYLSIGSVDAQTAIWMRDALMMNKFPTLDEMSTSFRYSPYRYGHAFWAYISYRYGEQYIPRLFKATARRGYRHAIRDMLFISPEEFSADWERSLRSHLLTNVNDSTYNIIGNRLITKQNAGRYNLSPSVSHDGKYIIFLSERDIYGLDLFLADAANGNIIRKVFSSTRHSDIDALNFMETSGTWSPDNRHFAFIAYTKGRSSIIIYDVEKLSVHQEISPECVSAISYPAWSPDGRYIVFSGQRGMSSDLFMYDLKNDRCENLTDNDAAAIQPSWSPDGKKLWYVTDVASTWQKSRNGGYYNIAEFDLEQRTSMVHYTFDGARNVNPVPTPDGKGIVFLSNRDGRRNLYNMEIETGFLFQITDYPTGVTGLTELSPAIGFGGNNLFYTLLWGGEFQIIKSSFDNLWSLATPVTEREKDYRAARLLPYSGNLSQVEQNLSGMSPQHATGAVELNDAKLRSRFRLDYIGNMTGGVMTGRFGTGIGGSVEALFSDILGQNLLYTGLSINGQVQDFGGQLAYMNQKRRLRMGGSYSHIPYRTGYYTYEEIEGEFGLEEQLVFYFHRLFEDKLSVFSFWPFNRARRLEAGFSYAMYNYQTERMVGSSYYTILYGGKGERVPSPPSFNAGSFDVAFVSDNSIFGFTSPVNGHRFRIQGERFFDGLDYTGLLFDFRKYYFVRPSSVALRLYHYGRYGQKENERRLYRLFIGYPWLIRGYSAGGFYTENTIKGESISIDQVIGSFMTVGNIEWRIPFSGPTNLSKFRSGFIVSELSLFMDAGVCWDSNSRPVMSLTTDNDRDRIPVMSTGLSMRFNIFGMLVLETYYALPFHQQKFHRGEIGFNIMPGF